MIMDVGHPRYNTHLQYLQSTMQILVKSNQNRPIPFTGLKSESAPSKLESDKEFMSEKLLERDSEERKKGRLQNSSNVFF